MLGEVQNLSCVRRSCGNFFSQPSSSKATIALPRIWCVSVGRPLYCRRLTPSMQGPCTTDPLHVHSALCSPCSSLLTAAHILPHCTCVVRLGISGQMRPNGGTLIPGYRSAFRFSRVTRRQTPSRLATAIRKQLRPSRK